MRSSWLLCAALLAAVAPLGPLQAQTPDEQAVRAVVDRMFDGMRRGDSVAVRSVFHPQARLQTTAVRDGRLMVREDSISAFVRAVGTPHEQVFDERISNVVIHIDGPLALAWMDYSFHLGDRFSHCGVNLFQLVRSPGEDWKVLSIIDTRRREGCPGAG
ncbi:MAG TPA: nuclear transport factor 2 family protein [Longimicrobiaceae bacterium]|nr:nuclear transport factor 2 family protein [Longimicrobiaceae bacterium]